MCKVADWFLACQGSVRINLSLEGKHGDVWTCPQGRWVTREGNKVVAIFILEMESKLFSTALCGGRVKARPRFLLLTLASQPIFDLELSPWRALSPPSSWPNLPFPNLTPRLFYTRLWIWALALGWGGPQALFFLCKGVQENCLLHQMLSYAVAW